MILTITIILTVLVSINFLLLIFSSNKTEKSLNTKQPIVIRNNTFSSNNYSTVTA